MRGVRHRLLRVGLLLILMVSPLWATKLCIRHHCFECEVAKTPEQQELGLMFRHHMPANRGMWFVFPVAKRQSFWMKNTYLSLDLLFVGADLSVAHIHHSAFPRSMDVISPPVMVPYVLEINGGLSKKYRFRVGDRVTIKQ